MKSTRRMHDREISTGLEHNQIAQLEEIMKGLWPKNLNRDLLLRRCS